MLCAGTTAGERCGGFYKMTVFDIPAYNRCQHEAFGESLHQLGALPSPNDDQRFGQPWDFQEKFDTTKFFMSTHGGSPASSAVSLRSCDV